MLYLRFPLLRLKIAQLAILYTYIEMYKLVFKLTSKRQQAMFPHFFL